mmetsp:Transcript_99948/g.279985  ORF Transcript_99948/g.279985 Transcript_99948/m.279985 type:complete len:258 (+) Transcript_99948:892-1665(+)
MLLEVVDLAFAAVSISLHQLPQELLVVLRPTPDGQLCDLDGVRGRPLGHAHDIVGVLLRVVGEEDAAFEALVPRAQVVAQRLLLDESPERLDDLPRAVVWQRGGPTCADAVGPVDQSHWDHGDVPLGLDLLPLLVLVLQDGVVVGVEDNAGDPLEACVDVTRAGAILATLEACAELPGGDKQVDVVGTDEFLRHTDNCPLQGHLAMVIRRVFGDVSRQLRHLHICLQVPLEAAVHDLALRRLEAVDHARNGAHHVVL